MSRPDAPPTGPETALADLGAGGGVWQPLQGGRTNRLWRIGGFVLKRHDPAAASPLFPNDPLAEARALTLFAPLGLAPRLRAAGPDWVIYDHCEGSTWPPAADPAPLARMLHRLHATPLPQDSFRPLPNGSAALLAHAAAFAPPGLPAPPSDPHLPPVRPCPVHADPIPANILSTANGPLLIDWQCPGMGDPSEDLAILLSPAMMWLYTGQKPAEGWGDALLAHYPDPAISARTRALLPIYRWRIMAHCAWKAARGDADYAAALQIEAAAPPQP